MPSAIELRTHGTISLRGSVDICEVRARRSTPPWVWKALIPDGEYTVMSETADDHLMSLSIISGEPSGVRWEIYDSFETNLHTIGFFQYKDAECQAEIMDEIDNHRTGDIITDHNQAYALLEKIDTPAKVNVFIAKRGDDTAGYRIGLYDIFEPADAPGLIEDEIDWEAYI